jgi:intracellular sulfur oxidation DsrE/DsrF family protein
MKAKMKTKTMAMALSFSLCLSLVSLARVYGEDYEALKGLKEVKAIFDVRIADPKSAVEHLKLVQQTFKDKSITAVSKNPSFVVVFMGPSVKLISKNSDEFPPEDKKTLDEIVGIIAAMSKDGINLEACLVAAKAFGVDPASILPEIKHVGNGWISSIGYQANGYSLVPAY